MQMVSKERSIRLKQLRQELSQLADRIKGNNYENKTNEEVLTCQVLYALAGTLGKASQYELSDIVKKFVLKQINSVKGE